MIQSRYVQKKYEVWSMCLADKGPVGLVLNLEWSHYFQSVVVEARRSVLVLGTIKQMICLAEVKALGLGEFFRDCECGGNFLGGKKGTQGSL